MTCKYESKYPLQCSFLRATGIEKSEARRLMVGDVIWHDGLCIRVREERRHGRIIIHERIAPVVPGQEQAVLRLVGGRAQQERVFRGLVLPIPPWRVIYALRRQYARALYLSYDPGRRLPGPTKHEITSPQDYDASAARRVAAALGLPEDDPVHLMRWYVL